MHISHILQENSICQPGNRISWKIREELSSLEVWGEHGLADTEVRLLGP